LKEIIARKDLGLSTGRILAFAKSESGAVIRLTEKQWEHIVTARPELSDFMKEILLAVEQPDEVLEPFRETDRSCMPSRNSRSCLVLA
jgi:hypothetical protein